MTTAVDGPTRRHPRLARQPWWHRREVRQAGGLLATGLLVGAGLAVLLPARWTLFVTMVLAGWVAGCVVGVWQDLSARR